MYTEKLFVNDEMARKLKEDLDHNSKQVYEQSNAAVQRNKELFICCQKMPRRKTILKATLFAEQLEIDGICPF